MSIPCRHTEKARSHHDSGDLPERLPDAEVHQARKDEVADSCLLHHRQLLVNPRITIEGSATMM